MIRLIVIEGCLNAKIQGEERITLRKAKFLIKKGQKMLSSNGASSIIIDIDSKAKIDRFTMKFINKIFTCHNPYPIVMK
jgi:hypothetical protein